MNGNNQSAAMTISKQSRIDRVFVGVLLSDKGAYIARPQTEDNVVTMVGNSVNDRSALTQENVGNTYGRGETLLLRQRMIH